MEAASDKLTDEFREVLAAAEELLNAGADPERIQELRGRTEEALRKARAHGGRGTPARAAGARQPFAALAVAAAAGLVAGILLARK